MDSLLDFSTDHLEITPIVDSLLEEKKVELHLLRLDKLDPEISGNKWFKLKYNLLEAEQIGLDSVLTFGGAYSNHIAATAAAGKKFGFKTIGVIRGEDAGFSLNPTLKKVKEDGMELHFISREDYKRKEEEDFISSLKKKFGAFYLIPEGGNNGSGFKGCAEILQFAKANDYTTICCACGTGTTLAGMISRANENQQVLGFSAFKGKGYIRKEIGNNLEKYAGQTFSNWSIVEDYHFGGYAKITDELREFKKLFEVKHHIELDFVYTSKMLFGIYNMIENNFFKPGDRILALHTGGLQGNAGFVL